MPAETTNTLEHHSVVPHEEWIAARAALLVKEKVFTRLRDELSQQRRDLPWEAVTKEYAFDSSDGTRSLSDLFDGRSQLVIYHAMFGPSSTPPASWTADAACAHCSFWLDHIDAMIVHLNHRDVTILAMSRAPYARLAAYKKRMGWNFTWVSSGNTDFNVDYAASFSPEQLARESVFYNYESEPPGMSEREGVSVFYRNMDGRVFHTYSAYARGIDLLNTTYNYLDLVPKGRDEGDHPQSWVRRHDEYDRPTAAKAG